MPGRTPIIDVLVLYTGGAREGAGGIDQIESLIWNAVDVTNFAFENSDTTAK